MRAAPRYGGPPVIDVTEMGFGPSPVIQQRDRLAETLSRFSADEWAAASRCAGWSAQDVAEHLVSVNKFWVASISAGLRGEPTRLLESFDPVAVPAALVEAARGGPPQATLEKLTATNAELATLLGEASRQDLEKVAEAPPGHLAVDGAFAHALWDAWVHERDVLLPLGRAQVVERDEVAIVLAYVAALGPACYLNAGQPREGLLSVRSHSPNLEFSVEVSRQVRVRPGAASGSTASLEGAAVDLIDGLSCRVPGPEATDDDCWLFDGLSLIFSSAV